MFVEDPNLPIPFINLKVEYPKIMEIREQNVVSVLDYIRQKGWTDGEKPDFVTDRFLLKAVVSPEASTTIHVVRVDGIYFLSCSDEEPVGNNGFRWVFKHMLTKKEIDDEFETEATIRKAMFKATVEGEEKKYTVVYSGKVDAIDDEMRHYEIKVASNGTDDYFWETNSYRLYWQALFGNIDSFIVGARTGKQNSDPKTRRPLRYPPFSIYSVEKIGKEEFFKKANAHLIKNPSKRQFEDGHKDLRELFSLIEKTVKKDGDGFVFREKSKIRNG
uniref:Decapping nuclease n=1 Tax=Caenorhabditis tropicalis TaxID=1561998 RepID=A0A1I7UH01_9PELO